jgi:hypothetical protein
MSWSIPQQIEQDIICGKAQYRTFQTGNGGQSILPVPSNSYVVIFGYDFSPAGGGIVYSENLTTAVQLINRTLRFFETQQISFYTGNDFYPFIHHVNMDISSIGDATLANRQVQCSIDNTPIARQVYITSTNDVTITVGLILSSVVATQNNIPVTNRTPLGLTYGGSPQAVNTQTNFGPALTPLQFMQPSPKDYADFAFGLLPAHADGQSFATPDTVNGLFDPSAFLSTFLDPNIKDAAAANYFLNLHYALYTETVPESRG